MHQCSLRETASDEAVGASTQGTEITHALSGAFEWVKVRRPRFDARVVLRPVCLQNLSGSALPHSVVVDTLTVEITYDATKRLQTMRERGVDFIDAALVFSGPTIEFDDTRMDYGERRVICYGWLVGRLVVVGYTPRGAARHIFSMRKANAREKARFTPARDV